MSPNDASLSSSAVTKPSKFNFTTLSIFLATSLFIVTEIAALAGAAIWSLSGLMHLGTMASTVLAVVIGVPGLLLSIKAIGLAMEADRNEEE